MTGKPERITDGELAYHHALAKRAEWAAQARQQIADIDGACRTWMAHLQEQHQLQPGDHVDDDGNIVRAPREPEPEGA